MVNHAAGVPKHQQECRSTSRSAEAPTGVPKHQQECRSTNRIGLLCQLITGLRYFYNYEFSNLLFDNMAFLATLCVHDRSYFIYWQGMMHMKSHLKHVFLFFYESTLPRNWNQSNRIIQTKVMTFSCQLVGLPILPRYRLQYLFFQCLVPIFGIVSLY